MNGEYSGYWICMSVLLSERITAVITNNAVIPDFFRITVKTPSVGWNRRVLLLSILLLHVISMLANLWSRR